MKMLCSLNRCHWVVSCHLDHGVVSILVIGQPLFSGSPKIWRLMTSISLFADMIGYALVIPFDSLFA